MKLTTWTSPTGVRHLNLELSDHDLADLKLSAADYCFLQGVDYGSSAADVLLAAEFIVRRLAEQRQLALPPGGG